MEKYGISIDGEHTQKWTDDGLIDSLSEAQDEAATENTKVQRGEGGIRHWKIEGKKEKTLVSMWIDVVYNENKSEWDFQDFI